MFLPTYSAAQDVLRIAAVVNDDVISFYDLSARMRMVMLSSGLQDTPEMRQRLKDQVLRRLIDEKLQLQEAKRNNISVPQSEIDEALGEIAKRNNVGLDRIDDFFRSVGVDRSTVVDQIEATRAWDKVVFRRHGTNARAGDEEIEEVLQRIEQARGKLEYLVSEIFLAVDSPEDEAQIRQEARRLIDQIRQGATFGSVAVQFSQAASAATQGNIGWVKQGQLDPEIDNALRTLQPGEMSAPIRTSTGYYILHLRKRAESGATEAEDGALEITQVFIGSGDGSAAAREKQANAARTLVGSVNSCAAFSEKAQELGLKAPPTPKALQLSDLAPAVQKVVKDLPIGKPGTPIKTPNGLAVMIVCGREEVKPAVPTREQVRNTLERQRMDMLQRRDLRDLRRSAYLDVRA